MYLLDVLFLGSTPAQAAIPSQICKPKGSSLSTEAFTLTLPGKCLDVSYLCNKKKKYRTRGNTEGALEAMKKLEEKGLGKLILKSCKGSVKVSRIFSYLYIPEADLGRFVA